MKTLKRAAVAATIVATVTLGGGAATAQAASQCVVMKVCSHDAHPGTWPKSRTTTDPLVLWLRWRYNH